MLEYTVNNPENLVEKLVEKTIGDLIIKSILDFKHSLISINYSPLDIIKNKNYKILAANAQLK